MAQQRDEGKTPDLHEPTASAESPPAPTDRPDASAPPPPAPLWNNAITMVGLFVMLAALVLLLTFALFSVVTPASNPYVDIIGFMFLPGLLVIGAVTVPVGILVKSWRVRRHDPTQKLEFRFPRIDLNDRMQRRAAKVFVIGTFILLPALGVSGYHGYHFTDSTTFCAKVCHSIMEPQGAAHARSSHARVQCAECHIGAGASWFVKAKLSGVRQVWATWRDTYHRPIPTAIRHLRPARETCEECHWPDQFYGSQLATAVRYSANESSTRNEINTLLKTGGKHIASGRAEGIHRHMALAGRIEYIAVDHERQDIPWVRWVDDDGKAWVFRSDGKPTSDPPPAGERRTMDCMDCHNRSGHRFPSPDEVVDIHLDTGEIDHALPFIKREAVAAMIRAYPDVPTAEKQIAEGLTAFYQTEYPEVVEGHRAAIDQAVANIQKIYRESFFPEMKVDWTTYPDNVGHRTFPGCFRCHNGDHVNERGEAISHDCAICHTFLNPVKRDGEELVVKSGSWTHPLELKGRHARLRCDRCHSGGAALSPTCAGCHSTTQALYDGSLKTLEDVDIEPDVMADSVDCGDCHNLDVAMSIQSVNEQCTGCHDDEGFADVLPTWARDVAAARAKVETHLSQLENEATAKPDEAPILRLWIAEARRVLGVMDKAGPLHNPKAALKIYEQLAAPTAGK